MIIAYNEERCLAQVLRSVSWVDEVIVVDSGSTDQTKSIASAAGARVIEHEFKGYGPQKRFAVSQARNDWVLSLDGDEVLSAELIQKLKNITSSDAANAELGKSFSVAAYAFPIENIFWGRPIRRWRGHDKLHPRLFNRQVANYDWAEVHEQIQVEGAIEQLSEPVWHYSYANTSHYVDKMNRYTTLAAEKMLAQGRQIQLWQIPFRGVGQFFKFYLATAIF